MSTEAEEKGPTENGGKSKKSSKETEVTSGKYYLIEVPNFNDTGEGSSEKPMSSYLRLGAVKDVKIAGKKSAPEASGEDLAARVTSFIDDTREREGCPDYLSPEERQKETAKLHIKGGWRDHSDGNRITTTRGDKVEVIKGNYRMVVLGRQEDEAGWDVSGGHVAESSITYAGTSSIEYSTEEYEGTWVVVERTVKGHVHTAYHGKVFDFYCGETIETITGSEEPDEEVCPNPTITEKTWAELISSYTGSEKKRVPSITDETWAETITSKTDAESISETTTVSDEMTSTTTVGSISETMTVKEDMTSKTEVTGDITEETKASSITSTTTADTIKDTTTGDVTSTTTGDVTSTTTGDVTDTISGNSMSTITGTETEIIMGAVTEVEMGLVTSVSMGAVTDITIGLSTSIEAAGTIEIKGDFKLVSTGGAKMDTSAAATYIAAVHVFVGKVIMG